MEDVSAGRLLEVARTSMEAAEYCFLMTLGPRGLIQARLMQPFPPEEDWTIWLAASPASRKVRELRADPRATLAYDHGQEGAYVTLLGVTRIVEGTDPDSMALRRRYWRRRFIQFWPDGPEGPDYALIAFSPSRIELMHADASVMPEPYGLRAAVLVREGAQWVIPGA
jgi:general stress protein 26